MCGNFEFNKMGFFCGEAKKHETRLRTQNQAEAQARLKYNSKFLICSKDESRQDANIECAPQIIISVDKKE